ncbi:hypothetical protein N2W54_005498 [Lotmaria passim]
MSGHRHTNDPNLTQNQGNVLGDRPCVRQSRLYREGCSGNAMKELMGQSELAWKTDQTEGCYGGGHVYDHNTEDHKAVRSGENGNNSNNNSSVQGQQNQYRPQQQQQQQKPPQPQAVSASTGRGFRPGAGYANRQTYNIFTGQ